MDANLFWSNPFSYFSICNYGHNFIFSTQNHLLWLLPPLFAYVSMSSDSEHTSISSNSHRRCIRSVFELILYLSIFISIIYFLSNKNTQESSWQLVASDHTYGDLAANKNLWKLTVFCCFQIITSLVVWQIIVLHLEMILRNDYSVFIGVIVISYIWRVFLPNEWNYSIWMIPPISCDIPLKTLVLNNWTLILLGLGSIGVLKHVPFYAVRGNHRKYTILSQKNVRKGYIVGTLCLITPLIMNAGFGNIFSLSNSITDVWLGVFGGIEWGHPEITVEVAFRNTVCVLMPFVWDYIGQNKNENMTRLALLSSKTVGVRMLMYACSCFILQALNIWISHTKMSLFLISDFSFLQWVIAVTLFVVHVFILRNIYVITLHYTKSIRTSQFIWLIPFCGTLLASNEDRMINAIIPSNWSMIIRSDIISPRYIDEIIADGSVKTYSLATFSPVNALLGEVVILIITLVLISIINGKMDFSKINNSGN